MTLQLRFSPSSLSLSLRAYGRPEDTCSTDKDDQKPDKARVCYYTATALQQQGLRRSSISDNVFRMSFQHVQVIAMQNMKTSMKSGEVERLIFKTFFIILD